MSGQHTSYRDVLRASSIIGGAQALNYLFALVRVKITAMLLGTAGVGVVGLYTSAIGLVGTVTSLGVGSSGVREVALAFSRGDPAAAARTARVLRRACWATGLAGWLLAAATAPLLSAWSFGSDAHVIALAVLGVTLLFGSLTGGQTALLQGARRIGDLARIGVVTMVANTAIAIGLYAWLGASGIVPVLISTAAISLLVAWWFARRVHFEPVALSWAESITDAKRLCRLGLAVMWSGILVAGLDVATRGLITREHGIDAAGLYQAAWSLSGLFAGFILSAMGTDFYPRLTSTIDTPAMACRTVNEQTEIGLLLALPGLLGTLAFAPLVIEAFYTTEFVAAAPLLPWLSLGVLGRVISWPLGFVQLAKGASRSFATTETLFAALQLFLVVLLLPGYGLLGVSYSFAITYFLYTATMLFVARRLIGFQWSSGVKRLLLHVGLFMSVGLAANHAISGWTGTVVGAVLTLAGALLSLRGLANRLGSESKFCKLLDELPGGRWLVKAWTN